MSMPEEAEEMSSRVYRLCLDPSDNQLEDLCRHAGTARWAFNFALDQKTTAHRRWREQVDALIATGIDETTAKKSIKISIPNKPAVQKLHNQVKGDSRKGMEGVSPWWHEVSTYAFQSAFLDADIAWSNWLSSLSGKRKGRKVGYPRFKKKGRARDSFRLYGFRPMPIEGYRRVVLPKIGSVRLHDSAKRVVRAIKKGGLLKAISVVRSGQRWYVNLLVQSAHAEVAPTRRQKAAGVVGVDLGVKVLAALSVPVEGLSDTGGLVVNSRPLRTSSRQLRRAQKALSRTQKGSVRRKKAVAKVGRLHHLVGERRKTVLHTLTKKLTTGFSVVAIEDLNVSGMMRSAKGTVETPGRNVRQKSGLNRSLADASFGEIRRQLDYKSTWYGSKVIAIGRFEPTSQTCSSCGWRNSSLTLKDRTFHCEVCDLILDRDVNAARNIAALAVASDRGETQNARRGTISPELAQASSVEARRPLHERPPPESDLRAIPTRTPP
jgi:putative transposase